MKIYTLLVETKNEIDEQEEFDMTETVLESDRDHVWSIRVIETFTRSKRFKVEIETDDEFIFEPFEMNMYNEGYEIEVLEVMAEV